MSWKYQGRFIHKLADFEDVEHLNGFVYYIRNLQTSQIYIGKKNFYSKRKKVLAKKNRSTDKRRKTYEVIIKESDWLTYKSSSKELQEDIKKLGEQSFEFMILELACSAKLLGYLELKYMFLYNVLENESYNGNILGRYYSRDLEKKC